MMEGNTSSTRLGSSATQQGFAAVAAVFLVVGLAALGAFMVSLSNTQQVTSAQDTMGTRAYWAARTGLEWAVVAAPSVCTNAALTDLAVGVGPDTVDGFTVTISCAKNVYTESGATRNIYQLTSTARAGASVGSVGYVERSVSSGLEL